MARKDGMGFFSAQPLNGRRDIPTVLGMAFLWPCLIPTTYYTAIAASAHSPSLASFPFSIVFPIFLITALAFVYTTRNRPWGAAASAPSTLVVAGALGTLGHAAICMPGIWPSLHMGAFIVGMACAAFYVAAYCVIIGRTLSQEEPGRVAVRAVSSFVIWEFISFILNVAAIDNELILVVSPVLVCIFALNMGAGESSDSAVKIVWTEIPWHIILGSVALVFFNIVYVKILFAQNPGTSDSFHAFTSLVSLAVSLGIMAFIKSRPFSTVGTLAVLFAGLVILYIAALVIVLLITDQTSVVVNRFWAASGRCFKLFAFVTLCCLASKKSLSPLVAFGFFLAAFVALPDFVSFDLSYSSPFLSWIVHADIAESLAIAATFIAAALSIAFLAREMARLSKATGRAHDEDGQSACKIALRNHGLSEREMQVAEYIYRGYSAKRTAEALYLSEATVNSHTRNLYRKLAIHSKQDLIRIVENFNR